MKLVLAILATIPLLALLLLTVGFTFRLLARHALRTWRANKIGEMVWAEMISEAKSSSRDGKYSADDFGGLLAMTQRIRSTRWPYTDRGVLSFVWSRGKDGLLHLYVGASLEHAGDGSSLDMLAESLGARSQLLEQAPEFISDYIAVANRDRAKPSSVTNVVEEPGRLAKAISKTLNTRGPDEEAALIITLDMMRNSEGSRLQANLNEEAIMRGGSAAQFGSVARESNIMVNDAVRLSIAAGASSPDVASDVLSNAMSTVSTTMGYTFTVHPAQRSSVRFAMIFGLINTVFATALTVAHALPVLLGAPIAALSLLAVVLPAFFAEQTGLGALRARFRQGEIVVPPFWWWSLRWKIHGIIRSNRDNANDERTKVGAQVAPPSCKQVFTAHPAALYEMVSFPVNKTEDIFTDTVRSNGLPSDLLTAHYPIFLGRTGTEQIAFYDLMDLQFSIYAAGAPGSGKSNCLLVMYAGIVRACLDQVAGMSITPIWAETKGSGAYDAWSIARLHPRSMLIDVHNPESKYRLVFEGKRIIDGATPAEVVTNCNNLVAALQYAYGDAIQARAKRMMTYSFQIAMLLNADEIRHLQLDKLVDAERPNVMDLSYYILGGDTRVDVNAAIMALREQLNPTESERDELLDNAIGTLSPEFEGNKQKVQERTESTHTKLSDLRTARALWTPDPNRFDIQISDLPAHFAPIVINMGPFWSRQRDGYDTSIDGAVNRRLLMAFQYLSWTEIKTQCAGWLKQRKYVPVFYDEAADVAMDSASDNVTNALGDALKEGRSAGHSLMLGCQFPAQLPDAARHNVLSVRTKMWFQLPNSDDQKLALSNLSSDGKSAFSADSIREMEDGVCAMTMKRHKRITPPFTLQVPQYEVWRDILFDPSTVDVNDAVAKYIEHEQMLEMEKIGDRV